MEALKQSCLSQVVLGRTSERLRNSVRTSMCALHASNSSRMFFSLALSLSLAFQIDNRYGKWWMRLGIHVASREMLQHGHVPRSVLQVFMI